MLGVRDRMGSKNRQGSCPCGAYHLVGETYIDQIMQKHVSTISGRGLGGPVVCAVSTCIVRAAALLRWACDF